MQGKQQIAHVALLVKDYDDAIAWYTEKLGFSVVEDKAQEGSKRFVRIAPPNASADATTLVLAKATSSEQKELVGNQAGGKVFGFLNTDAFDADRKVLKKGNVEIVRDTKEMPYGRVLVFQDLYGNKWDFLERKSAGWFGGFSVSSLFGGNTVSLPKYDGPAFDWSSQRSIDGDMSAELHAMGIKHPSQLENLSDEDRIKIDAHLKEKNLKKFPWTKLQKYSAAAPKVELDAEKKSKGFLGGLFGKSETVEVPVPDDVDIDIEKEKVVLPEVGVDNAIVDIKDVKSTSKKRTFKLPSFKGPNFDWSGSKDVKLDPKVSTELGELGIDHPAQLDAMSADDRTKFDAHMKKKGVKWDWDWVPKFNKEAPVVDLDEIVADNVKAPKVDVDADVDVPKIGVKTKSKKGKKLGFGFGKKFKMPKFNGPQFDWSSSKQVDLDPKVAQELEAMNIKHPAQLDAMEPEARVNFEKHMEKKGLNWDWKWLPKFQKEAPEFDVDVKTLDVDVQEPKTSDKKFGGFGKKFKMPRFTGPNFDWSSSKEVDLDPKVTAELDEMDIKHPAQLEAMDADARAKFDARMEEKGLDWNWNWLSKLKKEAPDVDVEIPDVDAPAPNNLDVGALEDVGDAELPEIKTKSSRKGFGLGGFGKKFKMPKFKGPSFDWSNSKKVEFDPKVSAELAELNIEHPAQLQAMDEHQRAEFDAHMDKKGLEWDWALLPKLTAEADDVEFEADTPKVEKKKSGFKFTGFSNGFKLPSFDGPEFNWGERDEIQPDVAAELKELGVKSPKQLEDMDAEQRAEFNAHMKKKGHKWDWDWLPTFGDSDKSNSKGEEEEEKEEDVEEAAPEGAERPKLHLRKISSKPFDFSQSKKISDELAAEFKELNVKHPAQLKKLRADQRAELDAHLRSKDLKFKWSWLPALLESADPAEFVRQKK